MTTGLDRGACSAYLPAPGAAVGSPHRVLICPLPVAKRHSPRAVPFPPGLAEGLLLLRTLLRFLSVPGLSDGLSLGSSLTSPSSGVTFLLVAGKRGPAACLQVVCEPLGKCQLPGKYSVVFIPGVIISLALSIFSPYFLLQDLASELRNPNIWRCPVTSSELTGPSRS